MTIIPTIEIVKDLYLSGLSGLEIAKIYNVPHGKIYWLLKKAEISLRNNRINSRKYLINHNFFQVIDTQEKAYWLGFMMADGYITARQYSYNVGIALAIKDKTHLELFNKALESTYPIKEYIQTQGYAPGTRYCRLLISSKKLFQDLENLGVVERKSLILKMPTVTQNLRRHLIRGYFDGDGSWSIAKKSKYKYAFKLCGTKEILEEVLLELHAYSKLYDRHKRNNNNFYISISGKKVLDIMEYLYQDASIYLDRKYQRYLQIKVPLQSNL